MNIIHKQLSKRRTDRNSKLRKKRKRRVARIESLDQRQLMAADGLVFAEIHENESLAATTVPQAAVMTSVVHGTIDGANDTDLFAMDLKAGDILAVDLDWSAPASELLLTLHEESSSVPLSLTSTDSADGKFAHAIDADGIYQIQVSSNDLVDAHQDYTLNVQTIALHDGYIDPTLLNPSVDQLEAAGANQMIAWLGDETVSISGPTGHGFEIASEDWEVTSRDALEHHIGRFSVQNEEVENFVRDLIGNEFGPESVETVMDELSADPLVGLLRDGVNDLRAIVESVALAGDQSIYTTYSTNAANLVLGTIDAVAGEVTGGSVDTATIESIRGAMETLAAQVVAEYDIPFADVLSGLMEQVQIELTTVDAGWGSMFGIVDSFNFTFDVGPITFGSGEGLDTNQLANGLVDSIPGLGELVELDTPILSWGVKLGADPTIQELAERFGTPLSTAVPYAHVAAHWALGADVGGINVSGTSAGIGFFIDPADPTFHFAVDSPLAVSGGFGVSTSGYIPMELEEDERPSGYHDQFFGHGFLRASGALPGIEMEAAGELYLDFDTTDSPDNTLTLDAIVNSIVSGQPTESESVDTVLARTAVGIKGQFTADLLDMIELAEIKGTFIQSPDGTFLHGQSELSVQELLGIDVIENSDNYFASTAMLDAFVLENGSFRVHYTSGFELLGYQLTDAEIIVDNDGAFVRGMLEIPNLSGDNLVEAEIEGRVGDGTFYLHGSGRLNLGEAGEFAASVTLDPSGVVVEFDAEILGESKVHFVGSLANNGAYDVRGIVDVNLFGMDMVGVTVQVSSAAGVAIVVDNDSAQSLKNEAAPELRLWAQRAQQAMEGARIAISQARAGLAGVEQELAAARAVAQQSVQDISQAIQTAERAIDIALANYNRVKSWRAREYRAWRSAVVSRQRAQWWQYASRRATEIYRYGRYRAADAAYRAATPVLTTTRNALTAIRNDAGWKSVGVDANPEVIRLTALLAINRELVTAAENSLRLLEETGVGDALEDIGTGALNAAAWLAERNGDLLTVDRVEVTGQVADLFSNRGTLEANFSVKVNYTWLGESRRFDESLSIEQDLAGALVDLIMDEED